MTDTAISHPSAQRITSLHLPGMQAAFLEQMGRHDLDDMTFEDRLALLIERDLRTTLQGRGSGASRRSSCATRTPASRTST